MTDRPDNPTTLRSPWPHRLATLLVCAVFPLIWVGGLVTSSDAGMAVPDWPSTYGYNLFLYPWTTWFFGPWDIFVEHGHRLLGALAGFLTIALVVSLWRHDARPALRWLGVAAFVAVVGQGVLGGMRVVLDARLLALLHGCTGPLYFALCGTIWYYTRRSSQSDVLYDKTRQKAFRLALLTTCFAYFQLVLGAVVRHMPISAPPRAFHAAVMFHLFMAAVLTVHVFLLAKAAWPVARLRAGGLGLLVLILVQLSLGAGTWVVNFGFPQWVNSVVSTPDFVVRSQSWPQLLVTTAHVAVGSLIVVTSLLTTLSARSGSSSAVLVAASLPVGGFAFREALQ